MTSKSFLLPNRRFLPPARIIDVTSQNGGHIASSLGAVEFTLALHYVFDAPKDKILWDVGHQSYAHKLLTGRRDLFHTLRQHQGLGGFTRISESPYDAFTTGHSSTRATQQGYALQSWPSWMHSRATNVGQSC